MKVARLVVVMTGLAAVVYPGEARGGRGKFTQNNDGTASVSMTVHVAFPPTQAHVAEIADRFTRASRTICDATDGTIQINRISLERNGLSASEADVLWMPENMYGRSMVTGRLPYGHDGKRLRTHSGVPFRTLVHEFGHLVLGLRDQYDEQRRFGTGCGIGPSVEAHLWTAADHTIMQQYRMRCAKDTVDGEEYEFADPTVACNFDEQCNTRDHFRCYEFTDTASELNTPRVYDTVRGDGLGYQGPRRGAALWLDLLLGETVEPDAWQPANRTLEYINAAGEAFDLSFEAFRDPAAGVWRLRAFVEEIPLEWQVGDDTPTTELTLQFGATSDCGNSLGDLHPNQIAYFYFLEQIDDHPVDELTLLLPATIAPKAEDRVIPVITEDLCEVRGVDYPAVWLRLNSLRGQPDGIGHGAYFGAYGFGAPSAEPVYQQLAACKAADVDSRWNRTTQRFETADQTRYVQGVIDRSGYHEGDPEFTILRGTAEDLGGSDWELMEYMLKYGWPARAPTFSPIDIGWASPVNHADKAASNPPEIDNRADCDYPIAVDTRKIETPDAVAIVIDRSRSMAQAWKVGGKEQTRLDWARKGAAGFVQAADGQGIELVVMEFSTEQEVLIWPRILDSSAGPEQKEYVSAEAVLEALDTIEADGATAVYDAIDGAFKTLPGDRNNAVLLLSDGEDNSSTVSVDSVIADSQRFDIPVFVAPVGSFDGSTLDPLASGSGGDLLAQMDPDEIPAAFFRMRAQLRGEDLALYESSRLSDGLPELPDRAQHSIRVEPEADRLLVLMTPDNESYASWAVDWKLHGPRGERIDAADDQGRVTRDPDGYYVLVEIPAPSAGNWNLDLAAPRSETPKLIPENQRALAHIEHDGPRCFATPVVRRITSRADAAEIVAETSWGGLVRKGASFHARVRRPDGASVNVPMTVDEDGIAVGYFDGYTLDGGYEVHVRCEVDDDARLHPGEGGSEALDDADLRVPSGYSRVATTEFWLDTGATSTPPPGSHDCDEDGIPNECELPADSDPDNDGRPDACDFDSDNDDLPDAHDPLHRDADGDGLPDKHDRDSDGDGILDGADPDPLDPRSHRREALGDFDGDGRRDRVWGEPDHEGRGRVLIELGSGGVQAWPNADGNPLAAGDQAGAGVAVGDFDGDGFDDLAVGAPGDDQAGSDLGAVWILRGSPAGLEPLGPDVVHVGRGGLEGIPVAGLGFGARLVAADFDCDGHDDLALASPDESAGPGSGPELVRRAGGVHVLYGSVAGLEPGSWLPGHQPGGGFGDELAAGDFDGDGCAELVVGAPRESVDGHAAAGAVYLLRGHGDGLSRVGELALHMLVGRRGAEGARFGARLWVRDRDDDGYDDLSVMVPGDSCGAGTKGFDQLRGDEAGLSAAGYLWTCEDLFR